MRSNTVSQSGMFMPKLLPKKEKQRAVLFVRIGWMHFYNGQIPGDERPVGGGSYNDDEVGHEVYNFREANGSLFGYFQPPGSSWAINLGRIDPGAADDPDISGVLVVMVAKRTDVGQVIVGWYK